NGENTPHRSRTITGDDDNCPLTTIWGIITFVQFVLVADRSACRRLAHPSGFFNHHFNHSG
ncbi:MAG: hypothetical protein ACKO3B_05795, partial [Bacteroidota bacterium]